MNLKKIGKVFTSKYVGTVPSSCEKKNLPYRAAVSQRLRNTGLEVRTDGACLTASLRVSRQSWETVFVLYVTITQ